jgi:ubiquinone/menaquinone biosynthesis C-methylase UbiE
VSTYVLMRFLESVPRRYDLGIRLLTLGKLEKCYGRLTRDLRPGQQVLDLGCGTGALALRAARKGAKVKGIDIDAQMLEIAQQRAHDEGLEKNVEFAEMGVAELDAEPSQAYDAVMSGLCFSELSEDELDHTLREVVRLLKPGGVLSVADETKPRSRLLRIIDRLLRAPLVVLTYLLTQRTTHPVAGLVEKVTAAGLSVVTLRSNTLQSFAELVARNPGGALQ